MMQNDWDLLKNRSIILHLNRSHINCDTLVSFLRRDAIIIYNTLIVSHCLISHPRD